MKLLSWIGYMFMGILACVIGNCVWCVVSVWWADRLAPSTTPTTQKDG